MARVAEQLIVRLKLFSKWELSIGLDSNSNVLYKLGLPDHSKFFQGHFVFQRDTVGYFRGRNGHFLPWKLGLRIKNV